MGCVLFLCWTSSHYIWLFGYVMKPSLCSLLPKRIRLSLAMCCTWRCASLVVLSSILPSILDSGMVVYCIVKMWSSYSSFCLSHCLLCFLGDLLPNVMFFGLALYGARNLDKKKKAIEWTPKRHSSLESPSGAKQWGCALFVIIEKQHSSGCTYWSELWTRNKGKWSKAIVSLHWGL